MGKKKKASASTAAIALLREKGISFEILEYEHAEGNKNFGAEAAEKLGRDPRQVYKTLMVNHDKEYAVAVVPVSRKLSVKAVATALGWKSAQLADPAVAQRRSGYVVGGISPLGQKIAHPTILDASAQNFATILVSGGKRGCDIELSPADLLSLTSGRYADIASDA